MPQMANIVVKKNDGTTDVTYTGVVPSSGDQTSAVWKSQAVGTAPAHQPELRLSSREGGKGARRVLRATFKYPQISTNTTTGVTSVIDTASADADFSFPKGMDQASIDEFAAQFANLLASALLKASVQSGYAPS